MFECEVRDYGYVTGGVNATKRSQPVFFTRVIGARRRAFLAFARAPGATIAGGSAKTMALTTRNVRLPPLAKHTTQARGGYMLDLTPRSVCANASLYDPRKSVPTNFKGEHRWS